VLTAAHCVHEKIVSNLVVRAGEWDCNTKNEIYAHEDRYVKSVQKHEHFRRDNLHNDIALLFLAGAPLDSAPNINTVCLPPQGHNMIHRHCYVSGWGKDNFNKGGLYQRIMKKMKLPIVRHTQCEDSLRTTRLGHRFELHKSFVCAGGEKGQDACTGDGGGPLVCPVKPNKHNRYHQIGVVAWVSHYLV
jgi:plasma kallikrein